MNKYLLYHAKHSMWILRGFSSDDGAWADCYRLIEWMRWCVWLLCMPNDYLHKFVRDFIWNLSNIRLNFRTKCNNIYVSQAILSRQFISFWPGWAELSKSFYVKSIFKHFDWMLTVKYYQTTARSSTRHEKLCRITHNKCMSHLVGLQSNRKKVLMLFVSG